MKKVIVLMKGKLRGQTIKKNVALQTKTYNYLQNNKDEDKKKQKTQRSVS